MQPPPPEIILQTFPGATQAVVNDSEVIIYSDSIPATMSSILKYAEKVDLASQLKNLHVRESTLEDVFLKLTGRRIRE